MVLHDQGIKSLAQNIGYDDAKRGHDDFLNNRQPTGNVTQAYTMGRDMAKAARDGLTDAINGQNNASASSQPGAYNDAQQAYKDAANAVSSNPDNPAGLPAGKPVSYQDVYNKAVSALQNQYQNGANQFGSQYSNGNSTADETSVNSDQDKQLLQQGFDEAKAGYQEAIKSATNPDGTLNLNVQPSANDSSAKKIGFNQAITALTAAQNVANGEIQQSQTGPMYNTAFEAAMAAKQALHNNPDAPNTLSPSDPNNNNQVYKDAYSAAITLIKQHYVEGFNDYMTGKSVPTGDTQADIDGYNNAKAAYAQAVNGQSFSGLTYQDAKSQEAFAAGQKVVNGYNDAFNKRSEDTTNDSSDAYQATKDAYNDANANTKRDLSTSSLDYVTAYNYAMKMAKDARNDGASQFVSHGTTDFGSQTLANDAQSNGAAAAENGKNDAKNNKSTNDSTDSAYLIGFNSLSGASDGSEDAKSGNGIKSADELFKDGKDQNYINAYTDGYNGTKAGYIDGQDDKQKADLSKQSQSYKDAYNNAYNDAKSIANQGALDALSNKSNLTGYNVLQQNAYNAGQNNANSAYAWAHDDVNNTNKFITGSDASEIFNGAQAGFIDGKLGNVANVTSQTAVYQAAYNNARSQAGAQTVQAIKDFKAVKDTIYNADQGKNDAESIAYTNAYDHIKAGFNDQINQNALVDTTGKDSSYKTGIRMAKDVQLGISDASNNPSRTDYVGTDSQKAAYAATRDGYHDGSFNTTTTMSSSLSSQKYAYDYAYSQAKGNGAQSAIKGANVYIQADAQVPAVSADGIAQQKGYNDAQSGYQAYLDNPSGSLDNSQTQAYKLGYAAAKESRQGITTFNGLTSPNSATTDPNTSATANEQDGFNGTRDGYFAGISRLPKQVFDTSSSQSRAYQDAYNASYDAARSKAQSGAIDQLSGANNVQTSWVQADQNAYAYGQQIASKAYTDANSNPNNTNYTIVNDASDAFSGANAGFADGTLGNNNYPSDTSAKPVYWAAYKKAQQAAINAAIKGVQQFAAGNSQPDSSGQSDQVSNAENYGFNQAQSGYQDFFNDGTANSTNVSYMSGYKLANDQQNGMNDALSSNPTYDDSKAQYSKDAYKAAFDGTKNGFVDGSQGNTAHINPENSGQSLIYNSTYGLAITSGKYWSQQGVSGFINGSPDDLNNNVQSNAYHQGFVDASNAKRDAFANYPGTSSSGNTNYQQVYAGYHDAIDDVVNGRAQKQISSLDMYYPAYVNGYRYATKLATQGAKDFLTTGTQSNQASAAENAVYQKGYQDASNAYTAAVTDPNQTEPASYVAGGNADNTFNGAALAFNEIAVGSTDLGTNGNTNPIFIAAYNKALSEAKTYSDKGAIAFGNLTRLNDVVNTVHNQIAFSNALVSGYITAQSAYAEAQANLNENHSTDSTYDQTYQGATAAFKAVIDGNESDTHAKDNKSAVFSAIYDRALSHGIAQSKKGAIAFAKDKKQSDNDAANAAMYNKGYTDAQSAYASAQTNPNQAAQHTNNTNVDNAYNGAAAAFNDVAKDTPNAHRDNDSAVYKAVYDKAIVEAQQNALAGANARLTGVNLNDGIKNMSTASAQNAYTTGFQDADKGYVAAQNDMTQASAHGTTSNVDSSYRGAAAAFNDVVNNTINAGKNADSSSVYQNAYKMALSEAVAHANDGAQAFSKGHVLTDDLKNLPNDSAKRAYTTGFKDAKNAYAAATTNPADTTHTSQSNFDETFRGTVDAYKAVVGHKSSDAGKASDNNNAYTAAYDKAFAEATQFAQTGAIDFGKNVDATLGRTQFGNNQAAKTAYTTGYNDAKVSYAKAQANPSDQGNHTSQSNTDEAYKGAAAAFNDVTNNQAGKNATDGNPVYASTYSRALNEGQAIASKGAQTAPLGTDAVNQALAIYKNNPAAQKMFNTGVSNANAAYAAARINPNNSIDHTSTSDYDEAYKGAAAGFNDVASDQFNSQFANDTNPVYQNAYTKAANEATAYATQGAILGNTGKQISDGWNGSTDQAVINAVTSGYNDSYTGYVAAIQDPSKNFNHTSNSNIDKSYNGAAAAFNDIAGNNGKASRSISSDPVYTTAYDKAYAVGLHYQNQGAADAANNVDEQTGINALNGYQGLIDVYDRGYKDSGDGYKLAQQNRNDQANHTSDSNSDVSYNGAAAGFTDTINGEVGKHQNDNPTPTYQNAYTRAVKEAQAQIHQATLDFNNNLNRDTQAQQISAGSDKDAYVTGYNNASDVYKSVQDSGDNDGKHTSDSVNDEQYRGAMNAFTDVINGTPGANASTDSVAVSEKENTSDVYTSAYAKAQVEATQDALNGATNFISPNTAGNAPTATGKLKAYNKGASDAQGAYELAQDDRTQGSTHSTNSNFDVVYTNAIAGFNDAIDNPLAPAKEGNDLATLTYNKALAQAKQSALNGVLAFNNDNHDDAFAKEAKPSDRDAFNVGYNQAQSGFTAAEINYLDAAHHDTDSYSDQVYTNAAKAFNDVNDRTGQVKDNVTNDVAGSAYNKAFNEAFNIANNGADDSVKGASQSTNVAQYAGKKALTDAYNAGYVDATKAYSDAENDHSKANDHTSDSNYDRVYRGAALGFADIINHQPGQNAKGDSNKAFVDAYSRASQQAFAQAHDGAIDANGPKQVRQLNTNADKQAYQVGFNDATNGYSEAQSNPDDKAKADQTTNAGLAYAGAAAAFNDVADGKPGEHGQTIADLVYQNAYNKALLEGKANANQGATAFGQGNALSDDIKQFATSGAKVKDYTKGYNDAQAAFAAAQSDASQADQHRSGSDYDEVYSGAANAFNDVSNHTVGQHRNDSNNPAYVAAYDKALTSGQSNTQDGALTYLTDSQDYDKKMDSFSTQAEKNSFATGFNDAKKGYELAQQNPMLQSHIDQNDLDNTYRGAASAFNDVKNGTAGQHAKTEDNPIYQKAYDKALTEAMNSFTDGANEFNDNKPNSASGVDANSLDHNKGYQDAKEQYEKVLVNGDDNLPDDANPAQKIGYQKAKSVVAGIIDATSGNKQQSNDPNYVLGYNSAQAALRDGQAFAQANGKLDNVNDIPVPDGLDPDAYRQVFAGAYEGYKTGAGLHPKNPSQTNPAFVNAYNNGYNKAANDIPAQEDYLYNGKKTNFNSRTDKNSYEQAYKQTGDGFTDGIKNIAMQNPDSGYYVNGYKAAKIALAAMKKAKTKAQLTNAQLNALGGQTYVNAFNGYRQGVKAAQASARTHKKLTAKQLAAKGQVFAYTYNQGFKIETAHQTKIGKKYGSARAIKRSPIPMSITKNHSAAYAKAYIAEYKRQFKAHMPRYIYNVKTIYTHRRTKFSHGSRVVKYKYSRRYNAHVFKVIGIKYYKNRVPRYVVSGGRLVTAGQMVQDAYYRGNTAKTDKNSDNKKTKNKPMVFRVIKPTGALIHTSKKYTKHNVIRRVRQGQLIHVVKVVKYYGLTRLYLGHNRYFTSNKTFVKKVR